MPEYPLEAEDLETTEYYNNEAASALGIVPTSMEPVEVIKVIGHTVDQQRADVAQLPEDDYSKFILMMGSLWATQVCRAYKWEWVLIGEDVDDAGMAIVSLNRAFVIYPFDFIKSFVDNLDKETTVILLFNMLDPVALKRQLSHVQAGAYVGLG